MIEYPPGTPSWVDLSSPDPDASARFYGELLGWEAAATEGPVEQTGGYRMFQLGGVQVAGLGPLREGQTPAWTTYVSVDDAAAAVERVKAAGGNVFMEPLEVMDAGTMAILTDPSYAVFAVWQPNRHRGAQAVNAAGALTMNELRTRDVDGSVRFYREVFGWDMAPIEVGGAMVYGSLTLDGRLVAGLLPMAAAFPPEVPAHWAPYFGVEDLDASLAKAAELGARVLGEPGQVPSGRFAALQDPQGAVFSIFHGSYDPPPGA